MPSQYLIKLLHKCSWWKQFNFHFCFIIEVLIVWHIISIFFLTGLIWIKSGYAAGCKKVLNYGGTNFPLPVNVTEHFPSPCSSDLHIIHISIYNFILQYIFSVSLILSTLLCLRFTIRYSTNANCMFYVKWKYLMRSLYSVYHIHGLYSSVSVHKRIYIQQHIISC